MESITRRALLAGMALSGLGLILAGCGSKAPSAASEPEKAAARPSATGATPAEAPATPQTRTDPAAQTEPTPAAAREATPVPPAAAYLAAVSGKAPDEITSAAIQAIGGMGRFVQAGADVIVKPNICNANRGPEYASTTNPVVVATLVKLALDAGARSVRVMDYPFSGSGRMAYISSGVEEAVKAVGGEMEEMNPAKFVQTDIPDGRDITSASFYQPILDADLIINVPIAKHHSLARLTLGGKNLLGVILDRGAIHRNMGQRVADLVSLVRPQLTVVDAVRMLMARGPTGGNLADVKDANTVIASHDIVAADAYATTLFGLKPEEISYVAASATMGLGEMDLGRLDVAEIRL
jgi:uncharacterized protein (DUF362 family)